MNIALFCRRILLSTAISLQIAKMTMTSTVARMAWVSWLTLTDSTINDIAPSMLVGRELVHKRDEFRLPFGGIEAPIEFQTNGQGFRAIPLISGIGYQIFKHIRLTPEAC